MLSIFGKKKERLERTMAKAMYLDMRENMELVNKVRAAENEQAMMAVLNEAGFSNSPGVIKELVRLFARELTDEDLVHVTGG